MTDESFFKDFAASTDASVKSEAYYYEHDSQLQALSALMSEEVGPDDTQVKMFQFTTSAPPIVNKSHTVEGVTYEGELLMIVKTEEETPIYNQDATLLANTRYISKVKPMIEKGAKVQELFNYVKLVNKNAQRGSIGASNTRYFVKLEVRDVTPVYGEMGYGGDGINIVYTITIRHLG